MNNNTMTTAKYPAAAAQILAAADKAAAQFVGIDWESGPQQLLEMIRRGTAEGGRAELESELAGVFWATDGSRESQSLRSRWGRLIAAAARGEATEEDAQELVDEESDAVTASAKSAAKLGRRAAELAGAGRWDDAIEAAEQAAAIERAYGDDPAWGGLADAIRALPEYQAEITARADYQEDDRTDEEIAAGNTERAAVERCGEVIGAVGERMLGLDGATRDAWASRYVAVYQVEIAEWVAA